MPQATVQQLSVANWYGIPLDQAHTINYEKALAYMKHCNTPEQLLERYMDNLEILRAIRLRNGGY